MPKNFESDLNRYERACQRAEAELGERLVSESGQYLDQIAHQPEAIANGLETFIPLCKICDWFVTGYITAYSQINICLLPEFINSASKSARLGSLSFSF